MQRHDLFISAQVVIGNLLDCFSGYRMPTRCGIEMVENCSSVPVPDVTARFLPPPGAAVQLEKNHPVGLAGFVVYMDLIFSVEADFNRVMVVAVGKPLFWL